MHSKDKQKGHQIFTNSTGYSNFQQIGHRILEGYSKFHRIYNFSIDRPQDIGRIFRFSLESLRMQSKDNQKGHQIFKNSTGYSNFQ